MPKKLSYRIDLYDLIFYNTSKLYRKDVATYMLRVYNKLGNKGRYIEQYELPFRDIDGIITYIHDKHPYMIDNKDTLLAKLFDQIKFDYYCILSAIKSRKMLCNDMTDVETCFELLVDPSIKEFSKNEVVIAKKMITNIDVDELENKYHAKYDAVEDISDEEDDTTDWDEDDNKCISYQQIEIDLGKHRDNGKGQPTSVEDVVRRQANIANKLIHEPKTVKEYHVCSCGGKYTKSNFSHHKRHNKQHIEWECNNGGKEG
jgi:hypothetical protein